MKRSPLTAALFTLAAWSAESAGQTTTWRPVIAADHGMVASGHPLASAAGACPPLPSTSRALRRAAFRGPSRAWSCASAF